MFLRIIFFTLIFCWFSVHGLVPVPPIYRKAELALKRYVSNPLHNPVTHSLLNVLIHDKQARAFISDQAIEMALGQVKEFDQKMKLNNENILRQVVYGIACKRTGNNCATSNRQKINRPTADLKHHIVLALDKFFGNSNAEDDSSVNTENGNKE